MELVQARPVAVLVPAPLASTPQPSVAAAPVDAYAGPASTPAAPAEDWEPEMVHALDLAKLQQGKWPVNAVIGARVRTFPFPLQRWLHSGGRLPQSDFVQVLERATFTSLNGARLKPRGRLPTSLGTAAKWYFVKSTWGRVYAFQDKLWRSTAKEDATRWAAHLARSAGDLQFAPSGVDDSGFVMGNSEPVQACSALPDDSSTWFSFDVI